MCLFSVVHHTEFLVSKVSWGFYRALGHHSDIRELIEKLDLSSLNHSFSDPKIFSSPLDIVLGRNVPVLFFKGFKEDFKPNTYKNQNQTNTNKNKTEQSQNKNLTRAKHFPHSGVNIMTVGVARKMCPFREVKKEGIQRESIWAYRNIEGISALKQK